MQYTCKELDVRDWVEWLLPCFPDLAIESVPESFDLLHIFWACLFLRFVSRELWRKLFFLLSTNSLFRSSPTPLIQVSRPPWIEWIGQKDGPFWRRMEPPHFLSLSHCIQKKLHLRRARLSFTKGKLFAFRFILHPWWTYALLLPRLLRFWSYHMRHHLQRQPYEFWQF